MRSRCSLRHVIVVSTFALSTGAVPLFTSVAHARPQDAPARDDSEAADRARRSAHGLLQRGLLDAAIDEYRAALRLAPRHELADEARYGLAVALSRKEQHAEVLQALREIRTDNDTFRYRVEAKYLEGRAALALDRADEAQQAFFAAAMIDPAHQLTVPSLVAAIELASRRSDDQFITTHAPKFLEGAGTGVPAQRVRYALGLAHSRLKQPKQTVAALTPLINEKETDGALAARAAYLVAQAHEALDDREAALTAYARAGASDRGDVAAAARYARAFLLEETGRDEDAIRAFADAVKNWPDDPQAPAARLHAAVLLIQSKQPEAAGAYLTAIEDHPEYAAEAAYWQSKADLALGRFDDAAARLAAARSAHETSALAPEMLYDEAVALFRAKRIEAAAERFDAFIERHPSHALAQESRRMAATLWHDAEAFEKSSARCAAYLDAAEKDDAHRPAIALLAAENLLLMGEVEKAAAQYRAVREAHPASEQAVIAARREGEALVRLGRADEAMSVLASALDHAKEPAARTNAQRWLGDAAFQAGDWARAEAALAEAIPALPEDAAARGGLWLKLGLAQARQDKHDAALVSFESAQRETEDGAIRAQAMFERGQSLIALERDAEAEKAFQQVIRAREGERFAAHAWNHLGAIAERAGEWKDAERAYTEAAKDESLRANALWRVASVLERAGDLTRAAEAWRLAAEAQADEERITEARVRSVLAIARGGEAERTLEAFSSLPTEAITEAPASLRGSARYEQAWALKRLGRNDEARAAYIALLEDAAADGALHQYATLDLADLDLLDEQYADAWKRLEPLLARSLAEKSDLKDDVRRAVALRAGQAAFALERFEEAQRAYTLALEQIARQESLWAAVALTAGESAFRARRWKEAVELLAPLVKMIDLPPMTREPALLRLGEAHAQVQNWEKSRETFALHREAFPKSAFWHQAAFGIAWADENAGNHKEAIEGYRTIVDRHDGVTAARAQFQIGECLFAQRRYDEALKEFMKVDILFTAPEWSAAALVEAGRVLEALRRPDDARAQFRAVVERFPDGDWAKIARERLNALDSTTASRAPRESEEEN